MDLPSSDSSLQGTPIEAVVATTGNEGGAVFISGKLHYQEQGILKHVVGNSFPKIIPGGVESPITDWSYPRTSHRIAEATTLNSAYATFTSKTSDGVYLEVITGYWGEDNSSGENQVSTAKPDAGGDALSILEDAATLLTDTIKEAGVQVTVGSRKGEKDIRQGNEFAARLEAGGASQPRLAITIPPFAANFTSDGVHLEGIIGFRGEDDNIGENHVSTTRPDAGGAALTLLRDSRPHFTATTKEVGVQSDDGSRNGETEDKIGQ